MAELTWLPRCRSHRHSRRRCGPRSVHSLSTRTPIRKLRPIYRSKLIEPCVIFVTKGLLHPKRNQKKDGSGTVRIRGMAQDRVVSRELLSRYNRDDLYKKVWAQPMRTLAKEFGVSDVALAKTCKKLFVPVPGRGYW